MDEDVATPPNRFDLARNSSSLATPQAVGKLQAHRDVTAAPSGRQYKIGFENQRATIVEVGGGIRTYRVGDRAVFLGYSQGVMNPGAHGTPLIPWPNRLESGRYTYEGRDYQVALTEPERSNAIHGFLRWRSWDLLAATDSAVTMGATIFPSPGYPFTLDVRIKYSLASDGLRVSTTARNRGTGCCPYGAGQHPYLSPGVGTVNACSLQIDARQCMVIDNDRRLPVGVENVAGTEFDFRDSRPVGDLRVDHTYTDLIRDDNGRAWVRLAGADGFIAHVWVDEHHGFIQIYTGDTLAPSRSRLGLAAEPMTCPPNAFHTGTSLVHLEPSQSVTSVWGAGLSHN